jgi:hypothetical protein
MPPAPAVRHILRVYDRATPEDIRCGRSWYPQAHAIAWSLAPSPTVGAGVIAALSPNTAWAWNVRLAHRFFSSNGLDCPTTSDRARKARRILAGEHPLSVLRGLKERAFFRLIEDPTVEEVCVDRHAAAVALGTSLYPEHYLALPARVATIRACYIWAARRLGLRPSALQAVTWLTWRRLVGGRLFVEPAIAAWFDVPAVKGA